jgi:hypothetical protein
MHRCTSPKLTLTVAFVGLGVSHGPLIGDTYRRPLAGRWVTT